MTVTLTQLYSILEEKIGKQQAETLTQYVEQKVEKEVISAKDSIVSSVEIKILSAKVDIIQRLDTHFKWLVGTLFVLIGLAVTIIKYS